MERFTFVEIKDFKVGDYFYFNGNKFSVDSDPTYYNNSNFYGDYSEKVEWTGFCETEGEEYQRQHKFFVQNTDKPDDETAHLFFKPTGEV
ncbi:MAG: hypothetical protein DRH57_05515 [Candidatus Cloacimonadota bacterium]|nr:MAG: hypothetical protein DRH57_05515 [Candidatus Cloacimonadota bacterium]